MFSLYVFECVFHLWRILNSLTVACCTVLALCSNNLLSEVWPDIVHLNPTLDYWCSGRGEERGRGRERECATKNDFSPTGTERQISLSCSGVLVALLDSLFALFHWEKGRFLLLSFIAPEMFHCRSYSLTADAWISWFRCTVCMWQSQSGP